MHHRKNSKFSSQSSIFAIFCTAALLTSCATTPNTDEDLTVAEDGHLMELNEIVGYWVIAVRVNDTDLNLILDTGTVRTTLYENARTRKFFDKASTSKGISKLDGSNTIIKTKTMKSGVVEVVGLPAKKSKITLFNIDQSPLHPWDQDKIDGAIGFDLLSHFDVRLNIPEGQITFFKPGQLVQSTLQQTVEISLDEDVPYFEGNLNFLATGDVEPARIWIDTGADTDILIHSPKDPSDWIDVSDSKSYVTSATGLTEFFNTTQLQVSSSYGSFKLSSDASIKHSPDVSMRAILGRPALSADHIEISYKSGFMNFNESGK